VLARYGRQTLASIARNSYLNGRQVKPGLIVLIQQHLVFHSAPLDPNATGAAYYEVNWQQSYAAVRYGRIARMVDARHGEKAANVISNLLTLGHTRIRELGEAYFPPQDTVKEEGSDDDSVNHKKRKTNGVAVNGVNGDAHTNGDHATTNGTAVNGNRKRPHPDDEIVENGNNDEAGKDNAIGSLAELDAVIHYLMLQGWIIRTDDFQYLSPGDMHEVAQRDVTETEFDMKAPQGTKEKDRFAMSTLQRKREMRNDWLKTPKFQTRRRNATDPDIGRATKRLKIAGGNDRSVSQDEIVILDRELSIRVNPEKASVAMRNDQLVRLAEQRLGHVTAKIYEAMLWTVEGNVARCFEEWPDPPLPDAAVGEVQDVEKEYLVTARQVAVTLDRDVDIFEGLDPQTIVHICNTRSQVDKNQHVNPPVNPANISLDEKTRMIDKHINALAQDPFHFVTWFSRSGYSQWHVEFDKIAEAMIQQEIENTIAAGTERDVKYGVKLIRALARKGKLDERQMCNVMMMHAIDIRSVVDTLTLRGFVQTQEVPKVDRREAKHSIHLVWFDRQRAREKLLHDTYKGMIRIMQRIAYEKEKVFELLRKAERTDVAGNEERWLSPPELDALRKWRAVESKLLLQLEREDDLVATLRDYTGPLLTA
jgi:DNA-directed RNA polymerase III subunit RPC3